jgi:hypothetical protein
VDLVSACVGGRFIGCGFVALLVGGTVVGLDGGLVGLVGKFYRWILCPGFHWQSFTWLFRHRLVWLLECVGISASGSLNDLSGVSGGSVG